MRWMCSRVRYVFRLQRSVLSREEAFHRRVVPAIPGSTHAADDPLNEQQKLAIKTTER